MGGTGSGRPAKPTEQKRRTGNPGNRKLPDTVVELRPANQHDLTPPAHLGDAGRFVWAKAWHTGLTWLSPDSDMPMVVAACELADVRDKARERYMVTGEAKDASAFARVDERYQKTLSYMGFSPSDRSRLGLAEVKRVSKLEALRARS